MTAKRNDSGWGHRRPPASAGAGELPRRIGIAALVALTAANLFPASAPGPEKHLLLDASLLESSRNITIALGQVRKFAGNPLFGEEYPWEPRFDNMYPTVIWDREDKSYKCWYNLFVIFRPNLKTATKEVETWTYRESGVAYATSADGIDWEKPRLADFPFSGQPSNVILRDGHGAGVFKDTRERDPARRYKMVYRREEHGEARNFACAFSRDGIHWSRPIDIPNLKLRADTHNNALWAPTIGKYVAITRDWGPAEGKLAVKGVSAVLNSRDRIRLAARTESDDFIHWTDARVVLRGLDDAHQVYAMPICYYAGIYLGFPAILDIGSDRVQTELAWSKDTVNWRRISPGTPLIGNAGIAGAYDWGCVYPAASIFSGKEIRIYYAGSDGAHTGPRRTHLALATLRPDGFAGAEPADNSKPGELVTSPLARPATKEIRLTADLEIGGSIQAILLDPADGQEIGRTAVRSGEERLTDESMPVESIKAAPVRTIKIRFLLFKAKLYSFEI